MSRFLCIASISIVVITVIGCADVETIRNVQYDERNGKAGRLDVYLPPSPLPTNPALIFFHGGGWRYGSKDWEKTRATRFAHAGYVVFSANYRLKGRGEYPRLLQDAYCVLGFVEANAATYGVDPQRIAVAGYSAGGQIASLIGVAPASGELVPDCPTVPTIRPRAVISADAPQDMRDLPEFHYVKNFLGGSESSVPERYENASPITHVDASDPPFLLIHGTDDWIINVSHSRRMARELTEVGVVALRLETRGGHHLFNPDGSLQDTAAPTSVWDEPEATAAMLDFLDRWVAE